LPSEQRKLVYEDIKQLGRRMEQFASQCMQVRDREKRKELMQQFLEFKQKTAQIEAQIRLDTGKNLSNVVIAQLNDLAYKAFRKQGNSRTLDKRAIKNVERQNELDEQLKHSKAQIKPEDLRAKYGEMIAKIGVCPYSQLDVVDALAEGDCMCVCLQITRSEATIQDPTKLSINKIVPVFMSLDMFLESSHFMLEQNQDAAGGFDYNNQGQLALAYQEPITGVFPVFLFKEHWKIANLKLQSLLGFLCTLDPLGYNLTQRFTVPFLILQRAIQQQADQPSEINSFVCELIKETCLQIMKSSEILQQ
jgi:hypothetical protein